MWKDLVKTALTKEKKLLLKERDLAEIGTRERAEIEKKVERLHELIGKVERISEQEFEEFINPEKNVQMTFTPVPKCKLGNEIWILNKHKGKLERGIINRIEYVEAGFAYYSDIFTFTDEDIGIYVLLDEEQALAAYNQMMET